MSMSTRRSAAAKARTGRNVRITERDRDLLEFMAEHRLVLAAHAQAFLGISAAAAYARLRSLASAGLVKPERRFHLEPACHQLTGSGLELVGRSYRPAGIDLRCYEHDIGVAWLWLAARCGSFGPLEQILTERRLRSHDARAERAEPALGVHLGGYGPGGRERLHYPDLLLVDRDGRRMAVELELSSKGRTRREKILSAYAADARVDAVLYLVENRAIARSIGASARKLGISHLVHVQPVRRPSAAEGAARDAAAQRIRASGRKRQRASTSSGRTGPAR
jgi:hypothetical protein